MDVTQGPTNHELESSQCASMRWSDGRERSEQHYEERQNWRLKSRGVACCEWPSLPPGPWWGPSLWGPCLSLWSTVVGVSVHGSLLPHHWDVPARGSCQGHLDVQGLSRTSPAPHWTHHSGQLALPLVCYEVVCMWCPPSVGRAGLKGMRTVPAPHLDSTVKLDQAPTGCTMELVLEEWVQVSQPQGYENKRMDSDPTSSIGWPNQSSAGELVLVVQ